MVTRGLGAKYARVLVDQERLRVILKTEMQREKLNFQIVKIWKNIKSISINAEQKLTYFNCSHGVECTSERFANKV